MKISIKNLACLAGMFFTFSAFSQEKGTNEFYAGAGFITTNQIINLGSEIIVTGITAGHVSYENTKYLPAFGIGYKRAVTDRWMLSLDAYYESSRSDVFTNNVKDGKVDYTYLTLGLGTDYHYVSAKWFQMYSGLAVAYTFGNARYSGSNNDIQDTQSNYLNFHVNALGFRFGNAFAAFAEIGFGYKGVIHAGVSLQL